MQTLNTFEAGKGINCDKINFNFSELQNQTNLNETDINAIASTSLKKDGSNLTDNIVTDFRKQKTTTIFGDGTISLSDNKVYSLFLLGGNAQISLPSITPDEFSHTICLFVSGNDHGYRVSNLGTVNHIYNNISSVDTSKSYYIMYFYNKLNQAWYYSVTQ